jgi:hypothetical protein
VGSLAVTGAAASLDLGLTPSAGAIVLAGAAPSLGADTVITPPAGSLSVTGTGSTLDMGITPSAGALDLTGSAPTIQATANTVVSPPAGSLVFSGTVPSIGSLTPGPSDDWVTGTSWRPVTGEVWYKVDSPDGTWRRV